VKEEHDEGSDHHLGHHRRRVREGIGEVDVRVELQSIVDEDKNGRLCLRSGDLARKFEDYGVEALIYTDIGRDGMMTGVNIEATLALAQAIKIPIIASGGLNSVRDVQTICDRLVPEGIVGAIAGRALYEGQLDLREAQTAADRAVKAVS